jgi:hypothetical protein
MPPYFVFMLIMLISSELENMKHLHIRIPEKNCLDEISSLLSHFGSISGSLIASITKLCNYSYYNII